MIKMRLALTIVLLLTACGTEHKKKHHQPPAVEEVTPIKSNDAVPAPTQTIPDVVMVPEPTPEPPKPEPVVIPAPVFDEAAYLKDQEQQMLVFVDKLKAIKLYDEIPAFMKATPTEAQRGETFTSPFSGIATGVDRLFYNSSLQNFAAGQQPCQFVKGTEYRTIARLRREQLGSAFTYPTGVDYRVFVWLTADNRLQIIDLDVRWKLLDGTYRTYSMGTMCEDGSYVLPAMVGYDY
jgi:hypothetical protein